MELSPKFEEQELYDVIMRERKRENPALVGSFGS